MRALSTFLAVAIALSSGCAPQRSPACQTALSAHSDADRDVFRAVHDRAHADRVSYLQDRADDRREVIAIACH